MFPQRKTKNCLQINPNREKFLNAHAAVTNNYDNMFWALCFMRLH